jgi:hypothetical protein
MIFNDIHNTSWFFTTLAVVRWRTTEVDEADEATKTTIRLKTTKFEKLESKSESP